MFVSYFRAMHSFLFTLFIQSLFLGSSLCSGCDNNCKIERVPVEGTVLSFIGEVFATREDIWVKLTELFDKIVVQLKIDAQFDFRGDKISKQNLTLTKNDVFKAIPSANWSQWNKIHVRVEERDVSWAPNPYDIIAKIGKHKFVKETGMWWRLNTIKSMQFLGLGDFEASVGCQPCEPVPEVQDEPVSAASTDKLASERREYVSEPTEVCGAQYPWIYILIGIIGLLIFVLILLLIMFKCLYSRQVSSLILAVIKIGKTSRTPLP